MSFTVSGSGESMLATISEMKRNILDVDRWLNSVKLALENGEYNESQLGVGKSIMLLSATLQKADKLSVNISNSQRIEYVGYAPKTLGGSKDVSKSHTQGSNLISQILEGKYSARQALETLRPKQAKNE